MEQKAKAESDFKALKEAYDVLMDPNKRHIYDTQGEAGVHSYQQTREEEDDEGRQRKFWERGPHDMPSAWEQYFGGVPFAFANVPAGVRAPGVGSEVLG